MSRFFALIALMLLIGAVVLHAAQQQIHAENFGIAAFAAIFLALALPDRITLRR